MRVAVVGSGISGLVAAWRLSEAHEVVLFERDDRFGGHADTHLVTLPEGDVAVDTGFLVFNDRTYPHFCAMIETLGIPWRSSDMSFGVRDERNDLEWRATSFSTFFAQRRNLLRPAFWRMLVEIVRFNRLVRAELGALTESTRTLADFLSQRSWSQGFLEWYLIPLGASIWSADPATFTQMPLATFARFFDRHGWLTYREQPTWRTIEGGSRTYVDHLIGAIEAQGSARRNTEVTGIHRTSEGVELSLATGTETFDEVVLATHSDSALALLCDVTPLEREVLAAIRYQSNRATLHCDTSLMPRHRAVWASWNYHVTRSRSALPTLTYWLDHLQGLSTSVPLLLTLNRSEEIEPDRIFAEVEYAHPIFDAAAVAAQARWHEINGQNRTWFCGAYWFYGFHEDGMRSALRCVEMMRGRR